MEGEFGIGNVATGENGSGSESESEGMVAVACDDLVAASRFESAVQTRKRADRVRRRKMRSSSASVTAASSSFSLGFSSLTVGSRQNPDPVAVVPARPSPPSCSKPVVFRLTPVYSLIKFSSSEGLSLQDIDRTKLRFLFQKILKNSDVNYLRRIIIPKKAAETYLPALHNRAVELTVYDVDGYHKWTFKYRYLIHLPHSPIDRYWPNHASRMYVFENAGEFVDAHDLHAGDSLIMYTDIETQNIVIQAKKSEAPKSATKPEVKLSSEVVVSENILPSDIFPEAPPLDDSTNQLFYDTSSFCNESPLDFLGGSAYHQYPYSSAQNDFTDNISFDDFHF